VLRSDCGDRASTQQCLSGYVLAQTLRRLPAGSYSLIVDADEETEFDLDFAVREPTPAPPGSACDDPIHLAIGESVTETLFGRQNVVEVLCRCEVPDPPYGCLRFYPDLVFAVTVDEPTDLVLRVAGSDVRALSFGLRTSCSNVSSQIACGEWSTGMRFRNLAPGEYFLIVEAIRPQQVSISLEALPLTVPIFVNGNDTCEAATAVPSTGGVFAGTTSGLSNDLEAACGDGARSADAVFRLDLAAAQRVRVSLDAAHDTVLSRFAGDCGGPAAACNDGAGQTHDSVLEERLAAGAHYYVVDGVGEWNSGPYTIEFAVLDP
jgi:hypothetical protein